MPALQCAAYGKGDHGTNTKFYFGYFENESDGYLYKSAKYPDIKDEVKEALDENSDLTIKNIFVADGKWVVFGEHVEKEPKGRELVFFDSYENFEAGMQERVSKQMRPICVTCSDDNVWCAYFEGKLTGKASTCVCESNEEMLSLMEKKIGDQGYSLQCAAWGDDCWFLFFMTDKEQNDCNWNMNSKYDGDDSFLAMVKKKMEEEQTMQMCTFGNGVWFGYWEGDVPDGAGFAWTSQPTFNGFCDHIKEQWEADDEEEEGGSVKTDSAPVPAPSGADDDEV